MISTRVIVAALLARAALGASLCAPTVPGPRQDFQILAGYSPASSHVFGTALDRRFLMAGASYAYACRKAGAAVVDYQVAVLPAAIVMQPAQLVTTVNPPYQRRSGPHAVYGFAVAPVGFRFRFRARRTLQPFLDLHGGVIASTEPVPEERINATGLNFFFDFGGGVRWRVFTVGYRLLHISNAGTTSFNPGLDNNVIYVGYSFLR